MDKLDISKMTRDSKLISKITEQKDKVLTAKEDISIIFPTRFLDIGLAEIQNNIKCIAIFIMVYKNKYTLINAPVYLMLNPSNTEDIEIGKNVYKKLNFSKDDIVIANTDTVIDTGVLYILLNEFFINGKVPIYLEYEDVGNVLSETKKYLKNDIGNDTLAIEILTALISRVESDTSINYRYKLKGKTKPKLKYVGLQNLFKSFRDTTSKLVGSYFTNGVNSALVDKEEEEEITKVEYLLRK